jgi:hypothetical protein
MEKPLTAVMQKEMTRKEFLAAMGFGLASILGFSNIIRLLTGRSFESHFKNSSSVGYGSNAYGGGKE